MDEVPNQGSVLSHLSLRSVRLTQNDIEDIEDLLSVMQSLVQELKVCSATEMDLQVLMSKYAHLETSLLESLEHFTQQSATAQNQKMLNNFIERYTEFGPDFQAKWDDRLWCAYAVATKGYRQTANTSGEPPSLRDLDKKLQHIQGLAQTLTYMATSPDSKKGESPQSKPIRKARLQPVIDAAVRAHNLQKTMASKRGAGEGCCHRCGIY